MHRKEKGTGSHSKPSCLGRFDHNGLRLLLPNRSWPQTLQQPVQRDTQKGNWAECLRTHPPPYPVYHPTGQAGKSLCTLVLSQTIIPNKELSSALSPLQNAQDTGVPRTPPMCYLILRHAGHYHCLASSTRGSIWPSRPTERSRPSSSVLLD